MSTTLAKFHNAVRMAQHPLLEASCIFTSRQYCLWDLALLWFLSATLPSSVTWMKDGSKQSGFSIPSIKATSVHSTSVPLSGVNMAPSASCSSWLGSECRSSDRAKLWFELAEGHQFGIPLRLLQLLLLGITAFRIVRLPSTVHLLDLCNMTTTITSTKAQKEVFFNKITNPTLVSMFLNLECLVPLPTMQGKLQAFLCPYYDSIQLEETVFFPDSGERLRKC